MFSVRGLRLYFCPGTLGCGSVSLPSCSSQLICTRTWDPWSASCHLVVSSLHPAASLCPPTGLDKCFFFNSLVVRLPYSLMFCQFWLFLVFKFVVVLLWVVRGGTVFLPMPPSWPAVCLPLLRPSVIASASLSLSGLLARASPPSLILSKPPCTAPHRTLTSHTRLSPVPQPGRWLNKRGAEGPNFRFSSKPPGHPGPTPDSEFSGATAVGSH